MNRRALTSGPYPIEALEIGGQAVIIQPQPDGVSIVVIEDALEALGDWIYGATRRRSNEVVHTTPCGNCHRHAGDNAIVNGHDVLCSECYAAQTKQNVPVSIARPCKMCGGKIRETETLLCAKCHEKKRAGAAR